MEIIQRFFTIFCSLLLWKQKDSVCVCVGKVALWGKKNKGNFNVRHLRGIVLLKYLLLL